MALHSVGFESMTYMVVVNLIIFIKKGSDLRRFILKGKDCNWPVGINVDIGILERILKSIIK